MAYYPGAKITVLCCVLIHFTFINADYFVFQASETSTIMAVLFAQGTTHLLYPLLGWLADTQFTQHKLIRASTCLFLLASVAIVLVMGVCIVETYCNDVFFLYSVPWYNIALGVLGFVPVIITLGLFEANAIQFGMDQMLEASSDQLRAFIHWYYWGINFGQAFLVLVSSVVLLVLSQCTLPAFVVNTDPTEIWAPYIAFYLVLVLGLLQVVMAASAVYVLCRYHRHLTIEPAGRNPFNTIVKVLRYAWKHTFPENRSALTYWEEDIPARIDLGKSKYGGPFTTEEVEDVKTFFRILILLCSLFGFHFVDNGFAVSRQLQYRLCPTHLLLHSFVTVAPNMLTSVTAIFSVPVLHYIVFPHFSHYIPNMLHRLGIGLALIFLQQASGVLVALEMWETYGACVPDVNIMVPSVNCYMHNYNFKINDTCTMISIHRYCGSGDYLFYWLFIPMVLHSIGYNLVSGTVLEFICAQAPHRMRGTLAGLWYASSALRFLVVMPLDSFITKDIPWFIYNGVKTFIMLLSLIVFCCIAKHYHYRQRNEIFNQYLVVEEKFERDFLLEDEYQAEIKRLYGSL